MKAPITTAQAMSHPDVALTLNTLGKIADELREERDQLRSEVERVRRETVEACAKICDLREHHIAALLEEQIKAAAVDSAKWFSSGVVSASRRNAQHIRELLK